MTILWDKLGHRILAAIDSGWCTRTGHPPTWHPTIDNRPATDNTRWWLTAFTAKRLVFWQDMGDQELAMLTPKGLKQLREWDLNVGLYQSDPPANNRLAYVNDDIPLTAAEQERIVRAAFTLTPDDIQGTP